MLAHDLIFFFNDTATTEIYTLSLHDALPISSNAQYQRKIEWVRRLLEPQAGSGAEANADADRDFLEHMRTELFEDRVYALTPKGEVVDLPRAATPLDFAYSRSEERRVGKECRSRW